MLWNAAPPGRNNRSAAFLSASPCTSPGGQECPRSCLRLFRRLRGFLGMNCRAKRLECVQLAGAVVMPGGARKREQAPRTPNASRSSGAPLLLTLAFPAEACTHCDGRRNTTPQAPITRLTLRCFAVRGCGSGAAVGSRIGPQAPWPRSRSSFRRGCRYSQPFPPGLDRFDGAAQAPGQRFVGEIAQQHIVLRRPTVET
jgi:hypothetical protein